MSDAREKLSAQAFTADELRFLEAIKRTHEETSLPPEMNVDVGVIAAKAFASYLKGLNDNSIEEIDERGSVLGLSTILRRTTPGINKTVADLMAVESEQQTPSVQFRRDFFYAVVPSIVLVVLGIGYFLFRSKVSLSSGVAVRSATVITVLAALAFTVWFYKWPNRLTLHLRSLRYSGGALVGGLAVATLGLLSINYGLQQKWEWQRNFRETRIETTSRAMAEVGFATVEPTTTDNLAEKTRRNFVGLENTSTVELESDKPNGVKVEAQPANVPTSVILQIEPYRANVYSANSTQADYEVLAGKVHSYSKDLIEITTDDPSVKEPIKIHSDQLMLTDIEQSGLQGSNVKVLFVPKSAQAIKMSLLRPGVEPKIIYNADSASLKRAAIVP